MLLSINIKDSNLKESITDAVDMCLHSNYDSDIIDAVGVPSRKVLSAGLYNDEVFMLAYLKYIKARLEDNYSLDLAICIEYDEPTFFTKAIKQWVAKCDKERMKLEADTEARDIKQAKELLRNHGFRVTK